MKVIKTMSVFTLYFCFMISLAYGQSPEGSWTGQLDVMGTKLRLNFHIQHSDGQWSATMDSPQQGATGIKVQSAEVNGQEVTLSMPSMGIKYEAMCEGDSLKGTFKQGGMEFPLDMVRMDDDAVGDQSQEEMNRPQEPQPPFPYESEEIEFFNQADDVKLVGTLTIPEGEGPFPGVILITGSGPQNRNSEIFGHKPFWVIADYLTRRGIAVLRYDERGVGGSDGDFSTATSADFARDASEAVAYLAARPEVIADQTGIIGHSEGGMVGPMVAKWTDQVDFLILLAGPGVPGHQVLLSQKEAIELAMGIDPEQVAAAQVSFRELYDLFLREDIDDDELMLRVNEKLFTLLEGMSEEQITMTQAQLLSPWMKYFIRHDPAVVLRQVTCPVLILNGGKDLQVLPDLNVPAIEAALSDGENEDYTSEIFPELNHLFQHADTGLVSEYQTIEETFAEDALDRIANWINEVTTR